MEFRVSLYFYAYQESVFHFVPRILSEIICGADKI